MTFWLSRISKGFFFAFLSIKAKSLKKNETPKNAQFLGHVEKFVFLAFFA